MVAKFFLVLCASALFVDTISAQCIGYGNRLGADIAAAEIAAASNLINGGCGCGAYGGYGAGSNIAPSYVAVSNGGGFGITSSSPIAPSGITIVSENAIEGLLDVAGSLPLLAAIAFEGNLPSAGAAGVSYGCGNGNVGISAESLAAAGLGAGRAGVYGLGAAGLGAAGLGAAGLGAGIYGAELAGLNAGLVGSNLIAPGNACGCGNIYY